MKTFEIFVFSSFGIASLIAAIAKQNADKAVISALCFAIVLIYWSLENGK